MVAGGRLVWNQLYVSVHYWRKTIRETVWGCAYREGEHIPLFDSCQEAHSVESSVTSANRTDKINFTVPWVPDCDVGLKSQFLVSVCTKWFTHSPNVAQTYVVNIIMTSFLSNIILHFDKLLLSFYQLLY